MLSLVVLPKFVVLSFDVLSFELGGEEDSVVVLGVEGCVVVASDVDSCVVVMDFVLASFSLVIDGSVPFKCVAFRIEVGVATVPFVVELLIVTVEFGDVPEDVVLGFTSETLSVDVPLVGEITV